jgi:hypothetical protein
MIIKTLFFIKIYFYNLDNFLLMKNKYLFFSDKYFCIFIISYRQESFIYLFYFPSGLFEGPPSTLTQGKINLNTLTFYIL